MNLSSSDIKQAIKIALIVGTLLNIINQGDLIVNMMVDKINYIKLVLTYFVPFFVSVYTAKSINRKMKK